jgi:hypothetical protein
MTNDERRDGQVPAGKDAEASRRRKAAQGVAAPDQLSPGQALEKSTGASRSQRAGNSGPVANPTVSFPDEPEKVD